MPSPFNSEARIVAVLAACAISFASAGCARKNVQAAAPVAAAPAPTSAETERPMNTAPDTIAAPPTEPEIPPSAPVSSSATPPSPSKLQSKPAPPPHKSSTEPAAEPPAEAASSRPPAPQISPQFSPAEQANFERRTNEDIAVAQKNLEQAKGKQLSAAQQDLFEKIRSFVAQSGEAGKAGDLARAQNLAQKARLLSDELVNSL
jgi:hypothetical protein